MLIKQKSLLRPRNLALGNFNELLIAKMCSRKSAISPLCYGIEVFCSLSDKAKLFAKNFFRNSSLDDSDISLLVFPSRTNLKLHSISVTSKLVEKVKINLNLSKASNPDCIPVVFLKKCGTVTLNFHTYQMNLSISV